MLVVSHTTGGGVRASDVTHYNYSNFLKLLLIFLRKIKIMAEQVFNVVWNSIFDLMIVLRASPTIMLAL